MKHNVQINVADRNGTKKVLEGNTQKIPAKKLRRMFGDYSEVICLRPGLSVQSIVIREVPEQKEAADGKQN